MDTARIDEALKKASDTQSVVIGQGALAQVDASFAKGFGDAAAVIVADETTFKVAGEAVLQQFQAAGRTVEPPIILPAHPAPYADFDTVLLIEEKLRQLDAFAVVVGSGTLNDVTKLASHRLGRQYMCVGTAASMDGYTAFGAAITKDGFKQTMACPAPRVVLADQNVLVTAPSQMNATGYGDLLGKITAGADWILADALGVEPIDPVAWSLVQDSLRTWVGSPDKLSAGDPETISSLFEGLILTGIAMQISASSRPASGCEHRFSHLWEMQALGHGHPAVPHGFKVGVGSIAGAALYELVLAHDFTKIDIEGCVARWPSREQVKEMVLAGHDIAPLAENAVEETLAKYLTPEELRARLELIQQLWPSILPKIQEQMLPAKQIRDMLKTAGCPIDPKEIGLSLQQVRESYWLARTIRSRYTVLDLVYETGVLDSFVERLFSEGGYWGE